MRGMNTFAPRGRGGYNNPMQGGGRGGQGGQMGYQQNKVPAEGYVCNRCGIAGHYIADCPKNNDKNYDPSKFKGVPRNQQWRVATVNPEQFRLNQDKRMRSLVKQINLYSVDDVTSLSINPY